MSRFDSFEVGLEIAGYGGKYGQSTGNSRSNAVSDDISRTMMTSQQFALAKTTVQALKSSMCDNQSSTSSSSSDLRSLSRVLQPEVYKTYASCLDMFKAGMQFKQSSGLLDQHLQIEMVYKPPLGTNAGVQLSGVIIAPAQNANCTIQGGMGRSAFNRNNTARLAPTMLTANVVYFINCQLLPTVRADGKRTSEWLVLERGICLRERSMLRQMTFGQLNPCCCPALLDGCTCWCVHSSGTNPQFGARVSHSSRMQTYHKVVQVPCRTHCSHPNQIGVHVVRGMHSPCQPQISWCRSLLSDVASAGVTSSPDQRCLRAVMAAVPDAAGVGIPMNLRCVPALQWCPCKPPLVAPSLPTSTIMGNQT